MYPATSKATPKAKDDPNRTPQTAKGAREAVKEVVATSNYLYIEAFTDPNCVSSSFQGFMAFKINTCIPAWMFSSSNQKLWLRNKGEVKETKIITQTDLFSDPTCSTSVSIKPVNQSNNQACGAWNSQGSMFVKFALKDTIPLEAYGSGVLIQSHGEDDCSDDATEIFYMVSRDAECQGRYQGVCGDDEVSFTRFEDFGCQGGKTTGYPMKLQKTCGFANSVGFSKYGYATCNTADAPAVITTLEGQTRFVGSGFKEDDDLKTKTKKKIAKLKKKMEKAEAKGKDELAAKFVEQIEALGGAVSTDGDGDGDDGGVAVTVVSDEAQEAMDQATVAVQDAVADALDIKSAQVEMLGSHYDYKGNNGFAIKYQVTGLDEDEMEKSAKKVSSSKTAKNIKKALKKAGVSGFSVEKADTTVAELVPTDFYEEEIMEAAKAVGKVRGQKAPRAHAARPVLNAHALPPPPSHSAPGDEHRRRRPRIGVVRRDQGVRFARREQTTGARLQGSGGDGGGVGGGGGNDVGQEGGHDDGHRGDSCRHPRVPRRRGAGGRGTGHHHSGRVDNVVGDDGVVGQQRHPIVDGRRVLCVVCIGGGGCGGWVCGARVGPNGPKSGHHHHVHRAQHARRARAS